MKPTYYQIIQRYLKSVYESAVLENKEEAFVPSYNLEKVNTPYGWIGSSGARRCRELAERGLIERKVSGRYVFYRHLPPRPKTESEEAAEMENHLLEALK